NLQVEKIKNQNSSMWYQYFIFIRYVFFKMFGLSPWKMETSGLFRQKPVNKSRILKLTFSSAGTFYNIVFFIAISSLSIYIAFNNSTSLYDSASTVSSISKHIQLIVIVITSLIVLIYLIRQKLLITANNRFKIVDKKLNNCADYTFKINSRDCLIFGFNFVITACLLVIRITTYLTVKIIVSNSIAYTVASLMIVQYAAYLKMIKERLKGINAVILKLGTFKSKIYHSNELTRADIGTIKVVYLKLGEICQDIGNFYGLPILMVIFLLCAKNTFVLYNIILATLDPNNSHDRIWEDGLFTMQNIFLIMLLVSEVTEVMKQVY
ncbi:GSCOCG00009881001-RA-CDS, partial [Cotesia congregata]